MDRSGIANDLLKTTQILLRKVPGGVAMSVTVMGTVLAAMTGIIGASVTMMTALALPTMMRQGYSHSLSCGVIAASGWLSPAAPVLSRLRASLVARCFAVAWRGVARRPPSLSGVQRH